MQKSAETNKSNRRALDCRHYTHPTFAKHALIIFHRLAPQVVTGRKSFAPNQLSVPSFVPRINPQVRSRRRRTAERRGAEWSLLAAVPGMYHRYLTSWAGWTRARCGGITLCHQSPVCETSWTQNRNRGSESNRFRTVPQHCQSSQFQPAPPSRPFPLPSTTTTSNVSTLSPTRPLPFSG